MTTKDIECPTCGVPAGKMCVSKASGKPLSDIHCGRKLISARRAAQLGIERLRRPIWAHPMDHIKIDIIDGALGPWGYLFAPFNQECNGRDPVDFIFGVTLIGPDDEIFEAYRGPLPGSDEYRAEVARYQGVLAA